MPIHLQERDRKMMAFVYAFRIAAVVQLHDRYFPGAHRSTSYARISLLLRAKLLRVVHVEYLDGVRKCVMLTEKGWEIIKNRFPSVENPYLNTESPAHDMRLAAVGLNLLKLKTRRRLIMENELQSASEFRDGAYRDIVNIQSDGIIELADPNGGIHRYAIEMEISKKTPERYVRKLSAYYNTGAVDGVLYICGDHQIQNAIARADATVRTAPKSIVYTAIEEDVLGPLDRFKFDRLSGGAIGLY